MSLVCHFFWPFLILASIYSHLHLLDIFFRYFHFTIFLCLVKIFLLVFYIFHAILYPMEVIPLDTGNRIKSLRISMGLSQEELGHIVGLQKAAIHKYENHIVVNLKRSVIDKLSSALNVSPSYLMGWDDSSPIQASTKKRHLVPVLGRVAAGVPIEAVEDILDWEEISEEMASTGDHFGLKLQGDSMEPRACQGDVVIVRQQSDIDSGDVAIVLVNGGNGTCKKVIKHQSGISLVSLNPAYEPKFYDWKEIEDLPVTILGKVVELRGKF